MCDTYHLKCEVLDDDYGYADRIEFYIGTFIERYLIYRTYFYEYDSDNELIKTVESQLKKLDMKKVDELWEKILRKEIEQ